MSKKTSNEERDQRSELRHFFLKLILEICQKKRMRMEIYEIIVDDFKITLTFRAFKQYLGELIKRRYLLRKQYEFDLRMCIYQSNPKKIELVKRLPN